MFSLIAALFASFLYFSEAANFLVNLGGVGPNAYLWDPKTLTAKIGDTITYRWLSAGHPVIVQTAGEPLNCTVDQTRTHACSWQGRAGFTGTPACVGAGVKTNALGDVWVYNVQAADAGKVFITFCVPHCTLNMNGRFTVEGGQYPCVNSKNFDLSLYDLPNLNQLQLSIPSGMTYALRPGNAWRVELFGTADPSVYSFFNISQTGGIGRGIMCSSNPGVSPIAQTCSSSSSRLSVLLVAALVCFFSFFGVSSSRFNNVLLALVLIAILIPVTIAFSYDCGAGTLVITYPSGISGTLTINGSPTTLSPTMAATPPTSAPSNYPTNTPVPTNAPIQDAY